jgi:hypothetical protein
MGVISHCNLLLWFCVLRIWNSGCWMLWCVLCYIICCMKNPRDAGIILYSFFFFLINENCIWSREWRSSSSFYKVITQHRIELSDNNQFTVNSIFYTSIWTYFVCIYYHNAGLPLYSLVYSHNWYFLYLNHVIQENSPV